MTHDCHWLPSEASVQLIDSTGKDLGVMPFGEANRFADTLGQILTLDKIKNSIPVYRLVSRGAPPNWRYRKST